MDREFMKKFYTKCYEDPLYVATSGDDEYYREMQKYKEMEKEFCKMVGGPESEVWKKQEECLSQLYIAHSIEGMDCYLLDASDKEKMMR